MTFRCMYCRTNQPLEDRCWLVNRGLMCQTCADKRFYTCHHCQQVGTQRDDPPIVLDDFELCHRCIQSLQHFTPRTFAPEKAEYRYIRSKRRFGVELESSVDSDFPAIRLHGTSFGVKGDCTCPGREFYSPILYGDNGLDEISSLCKFAERYKWRASYQCGYHLHIDVQNEDISALHSIVYAWSNLYQILKWCVDKNRWESEYCQHFIQPPSVETVNDLIDWFRHQPRYNFLNVQAYLIHGTFENRLHEGTFDRLAICNWVILNMRITDAASQMSLADLKQLLYNQPPSMQWNVIKDWIGDDEIIGFYEARMHDNDCPWLNEESHAVHS